jgi:hypothetical protein
MLVQGPLLVSAPAMWDRRLPVVVRVKDAERGLPTALSQQLRPRTAGTERPEKPTG